MKKPDVRHGISMYVSGRYSLIDKDYIHTHSDTAPTVDQLALKTLAILDGLEKILASDNPNDNIPCEVKMNADGRPVWTPLDQASMTLFANTLLQGSTNPEYIAKQSPALIKSIREFCKSLNTDNKPK